MNNKQSRLYIIILLIVSTHPQCFGQDRTVLYQKELSRLTPQQRLLRLESDLAPKKEISKKAVSNWEHENRFIKCLQDENQYLEIETNLLESLEQVLAKKDDNTFSKIVINRKNISLPSPKSFQENVLTEAISRFTLVNKTKNISNLKQFLTKFKNIQSVELNTLEYLINNKNRKDNNLNYDSVKLTVLYDIRGYDSKESKLQMRGTFEITPQYSESQGKWYVASLKTKKAELISLNRKPAFKDKTESSGLSKVSVHERSEAIRRGGYAVSVTDINGDGINDLFLGSAKKSQVLYGKTDGTWQLIPESHLTSYKAVKTAVFADFDNDGDKDVVMTLFEYDKGDSDLAYLLNDGKGNFKRVSSFIKGKLDYNLPMPAAVSDFNNDGLLDIYVGFPGKRDFTVLGNAAGSHQYPQGFFKNVVDANNGKYFIDTTKTMWGKSGLSKYNTVFPHSSLAFDYDQDGDTDLFIMDDRSNLSPIYNNQGGESFELINDHIKVNNKGYGMGIAAGDLDNDGTYDIAMTNVNFHARKRFSNSCQSNWYIETKDDNALKLFKGRKLVNGVTYSDITEIANTIDLGEGAAGVEFIDYNNDGLLDIYVANGLWSGQSKQKKHDLSSLFVRAINANKTYNDVLAPYKTYRERDWSFISILRDGKYKTSKSMAGYQKNRLFLNLGDMKFIEVAYLEGVDSLADGYVISTIDKNSDGKMDLILRNGDPGTLDYIFPTVQYFENQLVNNHTSITLTLEGKQSNRDAIGTIVNVKLKNKVINRQLVSNNGAAQSQSIIHVGLAMEKSAKEISIQWPSGKKQTFKNVIHGDYYLKEGKKLSPKKLHKVKITQTKR